VSSRKRKVSKPKVREASIKPETQKESASIAQISTEAQCNVSPLAPPSLAERQAWEQINHKLVAEKADAAFRELAREYDSLHEEIKGRTDLDVWHKCVEHTGLQASHMARKANLLYEVYAEALANRETPALALATLRWGILPLIESSAAEARLKLLNFASELKAACDLTKLLQGLDNRAESLRSDWCWRMGFEANNLRLEQQMASPKGLNPAFWEDLAAGFAALAREEEAIERAKPRDRYLRAYVDYAKDPKAEFGRWMISAGVSDDLKARFELAATKAGRALGAPVASTPSDFWLHNLALAI
jgi:hypothetical protein